MNSYHGSAGIQIFTPDSTCIRLQFKPRNGAVIFADLSADEAQWIVAELLVRLKLPDEAHQIATELLARLKLSKDEGQQ